MFRFCEKAAECKICEIFLGGDNVHSARERFAEGDVLVGFRLFPDHYDAG
jgi:hypothetical protein